MRGLAITRLSFFRGPISHPVPAEAMIQNKPDTQSIVSFDSPDSLQNVVQAGRLLRVFGRIFIGAYVVAS
jgi:hypothetical protein